MPRNTARGRHSAPSGRLMHHSRRVLLCAAHLPILGYFICLESIWNGVKNRDLRGFAAITDEPPLDVAAAGHNRCIVNFRQKLRGRPFFTGVIISTRGCRPRARSYLHLHLYLLNRGVLITPFHNMVLMSPASTADDVTLHDRLFAAVDEWFAPDESWRTRGIENYNGMNQ
jgi:hypothetical protein